MSYTFTFDLSKLSHALFRDIAEYSEHERIPEKIGNLARTLVKKFNVDKITGLPVGDSITVIEDLIDIHMKNQVARTSFLQSNKRALFLPHCCRKHMDSSCKATFDTQTSSYICNHCSMDCQVHQATLIAQKQHYDVYILPGASCVRKIFQKHPYTGIIGVACTEELKLAMNTLEQFRIPTQGIPLIKNGCSETQFNVETLQKTMELTENKPKEDHKTTQTPQILPKPSPAPNVE